VRRGIDILGKLTREKTLHSVAHDYSVRFKAWWRTWCSNQ